MTLEPRIPWLTKGSMRTSAPAAFSWDAMYAAAAPVRGEPQGRGPSADSAEAWRSAAAPSTEAARRRAAAIMGGALWVIGHPPGFLLQFALFVGGACLRSLSAVAVLALAVPAAAGTITGRVDLVDKPGRRTSDLSDVVVYLDGVKVKPRPATATVVMKGKVFSPHVVAVPVGGTVEFPNEDPIFHNAFSVSGENRFDLALYKRPKTGAQTFEHPGVVKVYCNIHPQMCGVVVVVDYTFFH